MAHVLVVPYPSQGHINPMLQFAKQLSSRGVNVSLLTTKFIVSTIDTKSVPVTIETISDGYDDGGVAHAESLEVYLKSLDDNGSRTLYDLIIERRSSERPFTCIVVDLFADWAMDIGRRAGLPVVGFSTQSAAVGSIYYYVRTGLLDLPTQDGELSLPMAGLPALRQSELPSMAFPGGPYPTLSGLSLVQFEKLEKSDWLLFNTFAELENQVIEGLMAHFSNAKLIGPTVPLPPHEDNSGNAAYGISLLDEDVGCMKWLSERPPRSVVYVSFGSFASLSKEQMVELAQGLKLSGKSFLWVVRESEQGSLPAGFFEETDLGLVVAWGPQLAILGHPAIGCFVSHCGWNSTLEALTMGVPLVAVPQWSDQPTNAKYVQDVWGVGVRVNVDEHKGMVSSEEIARCIGILMTTGDEMGQHVRASASQWKVDVRKALGDGGSSAKNLDTFVEYLNTVNGSAAGIDSN